MNAGVVRQARAFERRCVNEMAQSVPSLHHLQPGDREALELLDWYLRASLEAFFTNQGDLDARWIILLDDCSRELVPWLKKLNGEPKHYFTMLNKLTTLILSSLPSSQPFSSRP
jgi:hypothetical protein